MKTFSLPSLCAALCSIFLLSGCVGYYDSANQESLLVASGFRAYQPETAKQQDMYQRLEPYRLMEIDTGKTTMYVYKNERTGAAYIGGDKEYQAFMKLAVEQDIARDYYRAARMERDLAWGWYDAYGPYYYGPRYNYWARPYGYGLGIGIGYSHFNHHHHDHGGGHRGGGGSRGGGGGGSRGGGGGGGGGPRGR